MSITERLSSVLRGRDAIAVLEEDHEKVEKLFDAFTKEKDGDNRSAEKERLVTQMRLDLKIHTRLEEETFYPSIRNAIDAPELIDEALVEHQSVKDLIHQIEGLTPKDGLYDAKVTVLAEYVRHHVKEERSEMFPKARRSGIDLGILGERLDSRKVEIKADVEREERSRSTQQRTLEQASALQRSAPNRTQSEAPSGAREPRSAAEVGEPSPRKTTRGRKTKTTSRAKTTRPARKSSARKSSARKSSPAKTRARKSTTRKTTAAKSSARRSGASKSKGTAKSSARKRSR